MKTIVWDVDDVLNDLMRDWFEQSWRPAHETWRISYDDLLTNPPHELLGTSLTEYQLSLDAFRRDRLESLQPVPEAIDWFQQHGHKACHAALTAVPLWAAPLSAAWVMRHFGRWVSSFNVVPSRRAGEAPHSHAATKKEFLKWWRKADALVEDNPANLAGAEELGIRIFLVPQPWNGKLRSLREMLDDLTAFVARSAAAIW